MSENSNNNAVAVPLIGAALQLMPERAPLSLLFDVMQAVGCITRDCSVRSAALTLLRQLFSNQTVCLNPVPVLKALANAGNDRDLIIFAMAPLFVFYGTPQFHTLGCELLLWHNKRHDLMRRMQWPNLVAVVERMCVGDVQSTHAVITGLLHTGTLNEDTANGLIWGAIERGSVAVLRVVHGLMGGHVHDPNLQEHLTHCGSLGNTHIIRYLHEECGLDCTVNNGQLLLDAAERGHLETVQYLHEKAGIPCDLQGGKALQLAAQRNNEDLVLYLCHKTRIQFARR